MLRCSLEFTKVVCFVLAKFGKPVFLPGVEDVFIDAQIPVLIHERAPVHVSFQAGEQFKRFRVLFGGKVHGIAFSFGGLKRKTSLRARSILMER